MEQMPDVRSGHVQGGSDDVYRPLSGQLYQVFAQVGLDGPNAFGGEHVIQLQLLADHGLRLDDGLYAVLPGDPQHDAVGLVHAFGKEDLVAARVMLRSNSTSSLSRLAMANALIRLAASRHA